MTLALLIFRLKQQTRLNTQKKLTLREQQEVKKNLIKVHIVHMLTLKYAAF